VNHVRGGFRHDFPVAEKGKLVGLLTRSDLLVGLVQLGRQAPVADAMQRTFETAASTEMLDGALERLGRSASRSLPVLDGSRLAGILTLESVGKFFMVQTTGVSEKVGTKRILATETRQLRPAGL
jgi:CBS domain-containing protein